MSVAIDNGLDVVTLTDIHNAKNRYDIPVAGQTSYILNNRSGAPMAVLLAQERAATPVVKIVEAFSETVYTGTRPITDVTLINLTDTPLPNYLQPFKSSPTVTSGLFFVAATSDRIAVSNETVPPGINGSALNVNSSNIKVPQGFELGLGVGSTYADIGAQVSVPTALYALAWEIHAVISVPTLSAACITGILTLHGTTSNHAIGIVGFKLQSPFNSTAGAVSMTVGDGDVVTFPTPIDPSIFWSGDTQVQPGVQYFNTVTSISGSIVVTHQ